MSRSGTSPDQLPAMRRVGRPPIGDAPRQLIAIHNGGDLGRSTEQPRRGLGRHREQDDVRRQVRCELDAGNQIVYSSLANGTFDLWIMNADGSGRRPIATDEGASIDPDVSRDGNTVVMGSDRAAGVFEIWRMAIDGTGAAALTRAEGAWTPSMLPDGSVLYGVPYRIWRLPPDGGPPVQVTDASTSRVSVSPDGTRFVCSYRETATSRTQLAVYHVGEPAPRQRFDIPATADSHARWGPDGRSLQYIDTRNGVSNIWSLSLSGGPATQVTHFTTDRIFGFAWSRDGTMLALARGAVASDAVLITSER
jgi:Tol biopolymer transport system component